MTLGFDRKAMNAIEGRTLPYYIKLAAISKTLKEQKK